MSKTSCTNSVKFVPPRVSGIHLLDNMEDGTEMVAPDPFLGLTPTPDDETQRSSGK